MEEKDKEKKTKRLVVQLHPDTHDEIRIRAARRNISMKLWILRAVTLMKMEDDKHK